MKEYIKFFLYRNNLFLKLDLIRRLPEIIRWLRNGSLGIAPPPIKRLVLSGYIKKYNLKYFIETGTHLGDTLAYIASNDSIQAVSIELDERYFSAAEDRFAVYKNVKVLHGDSGELIPDVISKLKGPALFWLDGHYSGGDTGKGSFDTPVSAELSAILKSPITGHVVLIDDSRCFDGTHDYPYLDVLLEIIRQNGCYQVEVSTDIIRLTPKHRKIKINN
jgi:hypothetical protein